MSTRLAEPDYQLVWPRHLFKAEAVKLLNRRDLGDWNDRCELLLDDAFVQGYVGGPLSEFRDVAGPRGGDPWATPQPRAGLTSEQQFLRDLLGNADLLHTDMSHRRPYWRERKNRPAQLEERRHNVLSDALAKSDRGALFEIANKLPHPTPRRETEARI